MSWHCTAAQYRCSCPSFAGELVYPIIIMSCSKPCVQNAYTAYSILYYKRDMCAMLCWRPLCRQIQWKFGSVGLNKHRIYGLYDIFGYEHPCDKRVHTWRSLCSGKRTYLQVNSRHVHTRILPHICAIRMLRIFVHKFIICLLRLTHDYSWRYI